MTVNPLDHLWIPHTVSRLNQAILPTTITCGATPHIKSSWFQVYASTQHETHKLRVYVDGTSVSATDTSTLLDIGVGAIGSEVVNVANLLVGNWRASLSGSGSAVPVCGYYDIPIYVAPGQRIAVRAQSAVASQVINVAIDLFGDQTLHGEPFCGAAIDTIGALTASSHGTAVAAGVAGTAGAWVQLTASTTATYRALLIGVDAAGNSVVPNSNCTVDLATGASGSEVLLLPADFIQVNTNTAETVDVRSPADHLLGVGVPPGVRLAVRVTDSASGAQSLGIAIYGLR